MLAGIKRVIHHLRQSHVPERIASAAEAIIEGGRSRGNWTLVPWTSIAPRQLQTARLARVEKRSPGTSALPPRCPRHLFPARGRGSILSRYARPGAPSLVKETKMKRRKLYLHRETLRQLATSTLRDVRGASEFLPCSDYCSGSCTCCSGTISAFCATEYGCPQTRELSICVDCEI